MAREQGITVVMSLHEIDLAMKISDRVICVKGDRIFACGRPEEVLNDEVITGSPLLTSPEEEELIYNLAGQRLQKMQKGINIVGSRKVMVK